LAASPPVLRLPICPSGTDLITATYSGGNYPGSANTLNQLVAPAPGIAQNNLPIYTDNLVNGFQNWSGATVNLTNTSPVHSGTYSISVTDGGNYQALVFEHPDFNTGLYNYFSFWINGGSSGGQKVQIWGLLDGTNQSAYSLGALPANTWQQMTIPLASLGVATSRIAPASRFRATMAARPNRLFTWMMSNWEPRRRRPLVHLGVDAGQALQTVDARQFGLNTGTWDDSLTNAQTLPEFEASGCLNLRWPGGSTSDQYHWASDPTGNATFATSPPIWAPRFSPPSITAPARPVRRPPG
jgi:alpha-L-arabinofuranosidase